MLSLVKTKWACVWAVWGTEDITETRHLHTFGFDSIGVLAGTQIFLFSIRFPTHVTNVLKIFHFPTTFNICHLSFFLFRKPFGYLKFGWNF